MADDKNKRAFATRTIHAGQSPDPTTGAIMPPIYATSTYVQESPGQHKGYEYSRTQNPTRMAYERVIPIVDATARLLKPGGHGFYSTLNRTPLAFALGIVGAEHVLRLLPRGTHRYDRFIRPSELSAWLRRAGLEVRDITGLHYNPLTRSVMLGGNVRVNYLAHAEKPAA